MIELHGMSEYNTRFGWHQGNLMIQRFAEVLLKNAREECIFRVFGDDFVLCFEDFEARENFIKNWKTVEIESVNATCRSVEKTVFLDIL